MRPPQRGDDSTIKVDIGYVTFRGRCTQTVTRENVWNQETCRQVTSVRGGWVEPRSTHRKKCHTTECQRRLSAGMMEILTPVMKAMPDHSWHMMATIDTTVRRKSVPLKRSAHREGPSSSLSIRSIAITSFTSSWISSSGYVGPLSFRID